MTDDTKKLIKIFIRCLEFAAGLLKAHIKDEERGNKKAAA